MLPAGLKAYKQALDKPELVYDDRRDGIPEAPGDLMTELAKNNIALQNFINFSLSTRRMYIGWLNSARRPETRSKRIEKLIIRAEQNQKPGMM